jgi:hypothetical protein
MGCCEIRDRESVKMTQESYSIEDLKTSIPKQAADLSILGYSNIKDIKVLKIIQELQDLDIKSDWELVKSEETISIKKRLGSGFSKEHIVSKLEFSFENSVPLKLILDELNTDTKRKIWDKNLAIVENIDCLPPSYYLLYTVFSVLGFKSEYLEKKIVFTKNHSVYVVVYSVEDERKAVGSISRAHTFFGAFIIYEDMGKTRILVYNQTDPKSMLLRLGIGIGISKLSDWANSFKRHIIKIMS